MATRFALSFLGLFLWSTVAAVQIVESPLNQTVPVNSVARFVCRTAGLVVWQINNTQLSSNEIIDDFHMEVRIDGENGSVLLVNATMDNNGTRISCLTGPRIRNLPVISRTVFMIVFVHPAPPSNLTLLPAEPFTVSWIPSFALPGVAISYFLNATNLNTTEVLQSGELNVTNINFAPAEDSSPCDVYQFTVTAINAAGSSDPSDPLTASLPSSPGIVSGVNLTVEVSGDDLLIRITFEPARSCIGYPVIHYNLIIESSSTNQSAMMLGPYLQTESTDVSKINIMLNSSDGIYQNVQYRFQVLAVNSVGESISPGMEFYTTDVQLAEVQFSINQTIIVTCHFAEGSRALGCSVLLTFFNGSQSLNISRLNESFVEQEVVFHFLVHCNQPQISVYDWEADDTIGALPISVETSFSDQVSNESCETVNVVGTRATQHSTPGSTGFNIVPIVAGAAGAVVGVLLVTTLILIVTVVAMKKARRKREPPKQDLENGDCSKKCTQNNRGLTLPIPPEQPTHEMVVYDTPRLVQRPGEGIEGEKEYNILHLDSQSLRRISPTTHMVENDQQYSQLHQAPEYAILEGPVPKAVSPTRYSASPLPPPPLSVPPPPPPSVPPPPPTSTLPPPPLYNEIQDLPKKSVVENQYMEIPSAGTTIY